MKEKIKRALIVALAVLLIVTSIPVSGFIGLDLGLTSSAVATSGTCGENAKWSYDEKTKTLTVSGKGDMYDYDPYGDVEAPYLMDEDIIIENVVVKNGITSVGDYAFWSWDSSVKKITLANSVERIGKSAFYGSSITSLTIPAKVKIIDENAFSNCNKLKKVTIPDSVEFIGYGAFNYCGSLTEIIVGDGVKTIGENAFESCEKLQKITIGKNADILNTDIFSYENSVGFISVDAENPYVSSDKNGVLYNKEKTLLIRFPGKSAVTDFTVPDSVTEIAENAFSNTSKLKSVKMSSVKKIGSMAFDSSAVQKIDLGEKLEFIGEWAFCECKKLAELTIPASVTEIEEIAFDSTVSLNISKENPSYSVENGVLFNKDKTELLLYSAKNKAESYKVPETVKEIKQSAFCDLKNLKKIELPSGLISIGEYAFSGCENLTSITIPKSVELVDEYAFYESGLEKLVIEKGSTATIAEDAFSYSPELRDITLPSTVTKVGYSAFDGTGLIYDLEENGYEGPVYIGNLLYAYMGWDTPLTFKVKDGTTSICDYVLWSGLLNLEIPASVEYIAPNALSYCETLISVKVASGNKNFVVDDGVLYNKDKTRIIIYTGNILKTSFTIPDSVVTVDKGAFSTGKYLKEITFGKNYTDIKFSSFIGSKWFDNLAKDEMIYINGTAVGYIVDKDPTNVIILEDGTKRISDEAFDYLYLSAVVIPESVTDLGVFYAEEIYYTGSQEQWNATEKDEYLTVFLNDSIDVYFNFDKNNHTHKYYNYTTVYRTCSEKGEKVYKCPCGNSYKETTQSLGHQGYFEPEKAATLSKDGVKVRYCYMCYKKMETRAIPKIASIKLSKTAYTYDGKAKKPTVVVKDSQGKTLKLDEDYYVTYSSGRKNIGTYNVKVIFDGYYSGSKTLSFSVLPSKTNKITATQSASSINLKWNKVTGATGYRVYQYNSKTKKYEKLGDTTKNSYAVKNLKSGTTYKFAVKAYTKSGKNILWAASYTTVTTATKTAAPTVKLTAGTNKASLSWNKVTGATGYIVYMMNAEGKYEKQTVTTKTSYTQTGLKKGKTYSFRVRAYKKVDGKNIYGNYKTYTVKVK